MLDGQAVHVVVLAAAALAVGEAVAVGDTAGEPVAAGGDARVGLTVEVGQEVRDGVGVGSGEVALPTEPVVGITAGGGLMVGVTAAGRVPAGPGTGVAAPRLGTPRCGGRSPAGPW
jgi:hypothetical protein